jgi:hypothetical protein
VVSSLQVVWQADYLFELFCLLNFPGPQIIKIYLPAEQIPDFEVGFRSMELVIFYLIDYFI